MNRIPNAVRMKEFREEAVKLAMTDGVDVTEAASRLSIVDFDEDVGELALRR